MPETISQNYDRRLRNFAKSILPSFSVDMLVKARTAITLKRTLLFDGVERDRKEIFSDIYSSCRWGTDEQGSDFFSGPGSAPSFTREYEDYVVRFSQAKKIRQLLDIGCGDFQVGRRILQRSDEKLLYRGIDVVENLVNRNNNLFSGPNISFTCLDAVRDVWPSADLVLIREVLQHLSLPSVEKILSKVRKYKFVLITEHVTKNAKRPNLKIPDGKFARVDFGSGTFPDLSPFHLNAEEVLRVELPEGKSCLRTILYQSSH